MKKMKDYNLNKHIVGKCSQCGGIVSLPTVWMGMNRPQATCERYGAIMDETYGLPEVPTIPKK